MIDAAATPAPSASDPPPTSPSASPTLHLDHDALRSPAGAVFLPSSNDYGASLPALDAPLSLAAPNDSPAAIFVERTTPYGQLLRVARAGVGVRIARWHVVFDRIDASTPRPAFDASIAGPLPLRCFARLFVAPDATVYVGMPNAKGDVVATVVGGSEGHIRADAIVDVLRRVDDACTGGEARLYASASAFVGPLLDVASAIADAAPPLRLSSITFGAASAGPLDSPAP